MVADYLALIHQSAKRIERLARHRIARLDFQRFLEAAYRMTVHFFSQIRAAQVVMWKVARLVAARFRGAFQPGNRFLETAQFDQVRANVVVGIAELRVNFDRKPALGDSLFDAPLEMIRPTQESMGLSRGMKLQ